MKRFLAIILCFVMLFSLVPFSAFADNEDQPVTVTKEELESAPAAEEAEEAEITEQAEEEPAEEELPVEENNTNSNEDSVTEAPTQEESSIEAEEPHMTASLATSNGNVASVTIGTETSYFTKFSDAKAAVLKAGENAVILKLEDDINLTSRNLLGSSSETIKRKITLDLNGKTLTSTSDKGVFLVYGSSVLTITDSKETGKISNSTYPAYMNSGAKLNIEGGTLDGATAPAGGSGFSTGSVVITGGTFGFDPGEYVSSDYYITYDGSVYSVVNSAPTSGYEASVRVGEKVTYYYTDFSNAKAAVVAAGENKVTLTLQGDISLKSKNLLGVKEEQTNRKITLDLNGKTLTSSSTNGVFQVYGSSVLTIKDSEGTGNISSSTYPAYMNSGAKLNIEGGTLDGATAPAGGSGFSTDSVVITGGTFGFDPGAYITDTANVTVISNDTSTTYSIVSETPSTGGYDATVTPDNKNITYYCDSFENALTVAENQSTATIKLFKSVEVSTNTEIPEKKEIKLDLNGSAITPYDSTVSRVFEVRGTLTVSDETGKGKIVGCESSNKAGSVVFVYTTGQFNLNGGTIEGRTDKSAICKNSDNTGNINISGGTVIGSISGRYGVGTESEFTREISITGGWFSNAVNSDYVPDTHVATGECIIGAPEGTPYTVKSTSSDVTYTVSYDVAGGTEKSPTTVNEYKAFTVPEAEKEGSVFGYWTVGEDTETRYNLGDEVWFNGDVTLKANWTVATVMLTIGEDKECFKNVADAYDALPDTLPEGVEAATVTLLDNNSVEGQLQNNCAVIFDLNGKTISLNTAEVETFSSNSNKRIFAAYAPLTIKGDGTVDATDADSKDTDEHYIAYVGKEKTLTISGGNYLSACSNKNFSTGANAVINLDTSNRSWFSNPLSDIDTVDGEKKEENISTYAAKVIEESHSNCPYTYTDTFATVTYNVNGGVTDEDYVPAEQTGLTYLEGFTVNHDLRIQQPINTTNNLVFDSWNTKADGTGSKFASSIGITKDMLSDGTVTLYAQWKTTDVFVADIGVTHYASLSQAVYAADSIEGEDDVTIELTADVVDKVKVVEGNSVTIDLKGYSISGQEGVLGSTITVAAGGQLTLKDSSGTPGTISGNAQTSGGAIDNSGTLTINDVSITGTAKRNGGGLCSSGTVTMNSGSIDGTAGRSDSTTIYGGGGVYINGGTFTMNGGTIDGTAQPNPEDSTKTPYGGGAVYVSGGIFEMTGGIVKGTVTNATQTGSSSFYVTSDSNSKLTINGESAYVDGGIFKGKSGTVNISLGQFKVVPDSGFIDEWSETKEIEGDYTTKVIYKTFVIQTTSRISGTTCTIAPVTGGGQITHFGSVNVKATGIDGFTFKGWYTGYTSSADGTLVTEDLEGTYSGPSADTTLYAVYAPVDTGFTLNVTGSKFKVKINNGDEKEYTDSYSSSELKASDSVTVTFTDTDQTFMYWKNASGKVVSSVDTYTFVMGSDVTLTADSYTSSEKPTEAKVIFKSSYGQIIKIDTYSASSTNTIPFAPSKMGYTFSKWVIDGDATKTEATVAYIKSMISSSEGLINVIPEYTQSTTTYVVTVKYVNVTHDVVSKEVTIGDSCTVKADKTIDVTKDSETTTYNFQYWSDKETKGNILSYNPEYTVRATANVTVYAVYGTEEVTQEACLNITSVTTSEVTQGDVTKDCYTYTESYSLPDEYNVVKVGFVYSTKKSSETDLLLGNDVYEAASALTDSQGIFTLNITLKKTTNANLYVRGYIQYTKGGTDTNVYVMYTDVSSQVRSST